MKEKCKNHSEKQALSFCHNFHNYFCSDCLLEGSEYYYCKNPDCIQINKFDELANKEIKDDKKQGKLLDDLKKSPVPFVSISLFLGLFLGAKFGYFEEGLLNGILLSFLFGVGIWGFPFILTIFLCWIITKKEYRSKIFYISYSVIWTLIILFHLIDSGTI